MDCSVAMSGRVIFSGHFLRFLRCSSSDTRTVRKPTGDGWKGGTRPRPRPRSREDDEPAWKRAGLSPFSGPQQKRAGPRKHFWHDRHVAVPADHVECGVVSWPDQNAKWRMLLHYIITVALSIYYACMYICIPSHLWYLSIFFQYHQNNEVFIFLPIALIILFIIMHWNLEMNVGWPLL